MLDEGFLAAAGNRLAMGGVGSVAPRLVRATGMRAADRLDVLDETLELWASDVDLAWRARLLGWRCMYEPRALAWHVRFYSPTTRSGLPEAHRRLQFRNRLLMIAKNDSWADVRGDLHRIAFYELLAIGHVLLRERHLLRAYGDTLRALPATRRRRRVVQAQRAPGVRPPFGLRAPR